jgi:hypothetical protein
MIASAVCPFCASRTRVQEFAAGNRTWAEAVAYYHAARVHLETGELPTRRWEEAIAAAQGRLRPLPGALDVMDISSLHLERTGGEDGTFPFVGQRWSLDRALHRHRVQLRWIPEERLWALQVSHQVGDFLLRGDALQPRAQPCRRRTAARPRGACKDRAAFAGGGAL